MGATPNFDANDRSANRTSDSFGSGETHGSGGYADDISFNRTGAGASGTTGVNTPSSRTNTDGNQAQDFMHQVQTKASELTSRLMDRVNMDDITNKLEAQVREHPTRTLLIAAGVGFALGQAINRGKSSAATR